MKGRANMEINAGVLQVSPSEFEPTVEAAASEGWFVLRLDGSLCDTKLAFFRYVAKHMPLDPPLRMVNDVCSWDALNDSLACGIIGVPVKRVVIAWNDCARMREESPADYEVAFSILKDMVETVGNPAYTCENPTQLCVLICLAAAGF